MTNREAILSGIPVDVNTSAIDKIIIDRSLSGDGTYNADNKKIVELATADALVEAAKQPDFNEGDLSVKIPRHKLLREAKRLYRLHGELEKASALCGGFGTNKSNSW